LSAISTSYAPTSLELFGGTGHFYPSSWTKNVLQIWFSERINHKKNPVTLLSSHATTQEEEVWGRHDSNPHIKPKIITSYNKLMGGTDSLDMKLYTYLDERRTVRYWKKVAFSIIVRMVLNSYILHSENYRGPGKLISTYNYTLSIIESLEGGVVGTQVQRWSRSSSGTTRTQKTP
jgi:hypothetical protein